MIIDFNKIREKKINNVAHELATYMSERLKDYIEAKVKLIIGVTLFDNEGGCATIPDIEDKLISELSLYCFLKIAEILPSLPELPDSGKMDFITSLDKFINDMVKDKASNVLEFFKEMDKVRKSLSDPE